MKPENPAAIESAALLLRPGRVSTRRHLLILSLIFCTALGVRLLNWRAAGAGVSAVQTRVAQNYRHQAHLIQANGLASLFAPASPTNDPDLLGHPPGYPILLSLVYGLAPDSNRATQLVQMLLDSLATVVITLIAFELFPTAVGALAGMFAACAPQFSWNSLLLLPDSLAALPILLAVLLIIRTRGQTDRARLLALLAAGALFGLSCWLRANALLLAPFATLLLPCLYQRGQRWLPALVLVGGACLVIAPLTIRNAIVFGKLIPVSLGAGQTLIEGLADYDPGGTLGLPQTDLDLISGEAETFHRPEYANSLFSPDGVARDRQRLARGFAAIRAHPLWFAGVMVQRAAAMLRLERTPLRLVATDSSLQFVQWPLRGLQRIFITAVFLPLALLGAGMLSYQRQFQKLAILLLVPGYYFCTQSALHTEARYVLVIHYYLFVLAAVASYTIAVRIKQNLLTIAGRLRLDT
jgi:4-amino-4-deoxy-L-arabinose transferase-like glycosyltransferase